MKRFVCFLLTFLMIVSLVPATVLTASAASSLKTSEQAINIIKQFEGFQAKPYLDGGKHYIGYGTCIDNPDIYVDGITAAEATELLRDHIHGTKDIKGVDEYINNFAKRFNIAFTQYQHDALAVFSYNCGTGWMSESPSTNGLVNAVVNGKKGNDFLNAICQYNGTNASSDYFRGLMNRRLAEANMYLNNVYSSTAPSGYTYVVLDTKGGTLQDAFGNNLIMYAYAVSSSPALNLKPTGTGNFLGWYNKDGKPVTVLDSTTSKATLTAKYENGSGSAAAYDINSSEAASRNVYYTADMLAAGNQKDTLKANTKFSVTLEKIVGDIKWVYGKGTNTKGKSVEGWVPYKNIKDEDTSTEKVLATGTITASALTVREGATTDSNALSGTLSKGSVVKILAYKNEYTASGTRSWGKIAYNGGYGWINLAYVDLRESTAEDNTSLLGKTGKIVNADMVNVRVGAGVDKALANPKQIAKDTKVTIYETQQVAGGATWARVKWNNNLHEGWVYMYYIQVDGQTNGSTVGGSTPDVAIYTGVVSSNTNLNIRSNPSVTSTQRGSLPRGTSINIYEETTTNGVKWGRTDKGWVCLLYVNLTATGNKPSNGADHVVVKKVGTVTASSLILRKNATNNSEALNTLGKGAVVTIVEQMSEETTTGTKLWGKVTYDGEEGWINLAYVDVEEVKETIPDTPTDPDSGVYGIIVNCTQVNVRAAAGVRNTLVTTLPRGTKVTVYERTTVDNAPWGRVKDGWVCMNYVEITGNAPSDGTGSGSGSGSNSGIISGTITGTVNSNIDLNVRAAAGLGNGKIGSLRKGTSVTVTEQKVADGMTWGKISYNGTPGWICMSYISITSNSASGTGVMGTIARCFSHVNVRSAAGVGNALVGTIPVGSRVEVYEKTLVNGEYWGRVAQGWICMQYVLMDAELPDATEPTTPETTDPVDSQSVNPNPSVNFAFTATTTEELNVRKDAVSASDKAGTLNAGTPVNILALKAGKDGKNEIWGKINDYGTPGWINLDYVTFTITGYVHSSALTVYASADADSENIGTLSLNDKVTVERVGLSGNTVYGKILVVEKSKGGTLDYSYKGWVDMSKLGKEPLEVTPVLSATEKPAAVNIHGKTLAKSPAYTTVKATELAFYLEPNASVYMSDFFADHGKLWGKVIGKVDGENVEAYVEITSLVYVLNNARVVTETVNVRSVFASTADDTILGQLAVGSEVTITSLAVDSNGHIWGQIQSVTSGETFAPNNWIDLTYTSWK